MPLQEHDLRRVCKVCQKEMLPLNCLSDITSSEFYCKHCHISEPMRIEVASWFCARQKQNMMEHAK